ncbi:GTPase-GDP dissociation stimulator vimar isoform X2 [Toxorhynchites rutilus septentrionalis]|uniref:GTPase-GDP dissociation stimulator vimar isoform X2 n=1 Tax=Toxorhynchites rutilus septentrionalis TaxID=329112 RepID=UPI00247B294D|nr:GTPase-GDP dissociation stimulator vimar isoform X2 [Toxorhynchites rutilus septentrionalis]
MEADMEEIIAGLKNATLEKSPEQALPRLKQIVEAESNLNEKYDIKSDLLELLSLGNQDVHVQVARCIAEVAKAENQRDKFTKEDIIQKLLSFLSGNENSQLEMNVQVCRALGNICYANDDARNIIKALKGDERIFSLLNLDMDTDEEDKDQFVRVRCGLISNYLLGSDDIAERAVELQIIAKIEKIIARCVVDVDKYEDLLLNVLPPLSILTEQISDLYFESSLNKLIAQVLAKCTNPDLAESCLALLHYEAQNDDVKLLLAEEGLCETIYKLLEKYKTFANTDEARVLMKLACDLIVLILTGDKSMHYLYSTPLLKYMEDWLDSQDVELLTTGVLALGNFARTDSHCIYMVENKIMNKLLDILAKNNGIDHQMTLQHALLSTLKNLVIPKPNKAAVIEAGLVDIILPMLQIHQPPVVFKLLGTLRMTVDGQEKLAQELLQNEKLIKQLVHWSKTSEFTGVLGESLRLMAWLIKHAYHASKDLAVADDTGLRKFVAVDGAVDSMVGMLTSTHLVMQNEALIALSILTTIFHSESSNDVKLDVLLNNADVGAKLAEQITLNGETMTKEIVDNLQTFVKLLKTSETCTDNLRKHNIDELMKSIPSLVEYGTL